MTVQDLVPPDDLTKDLLQKNAAMDFSQGRSMEEGWCQVATECGYDQHLSRSPARLAYEDGYRAAERAKK